MYVCALLSWCFRDFVLLMICLLNCCICILLLFCCLFDCFADRELVVVGDHVLGSRLLCGFCLLACFEFGACLIFGLILWLLCFGVCFVCLFIVYIACLGVCIWVPFT